MVAGLLGKEMEIREKMVGPRFAAANDEAANVYFDRDRRQQHRLRKKPAISVRQTSGGFV
jgi:hypothetical protein